MEQQRCNRNLFAIFHIMCRSPRFWGNHYNVSDMCLIALVRFMVPNVVDGWSRICYFFHLSSRVKIYGCRCLPRRNMLCVSHSELMAGDTELRKKQRRMKTLKDEYEARMKDGGYEVAISLGTRDEFG